MFYRLAQPKKWMSILNWITPGAYLIAAFCFSIGIFIAFFASPADYQQGDSVRIMYVHVPASWFALMIYGVMGLCSISYFIFRLPIAAQLAYAAAPVGMLYAFISLVTGSLWGKPMWGTWWVWDARLTSMLILFFMYVGYILFIQSIDDKDKAYKMGSALAIIGLINLPIIKFSVDWWNTLHQPSSVLKLSGPSIHTSMLTPLLWMAAAYFFLFIAITAHRLQNQLLLFKLKTMQLKLSWQR
ncbi:MAG: heme ABC transporter permease [Alphaproteobacteria bacterium]|nr:heme ABC transporter permease [Alphaproteobacteria bacterium]